MKGLRIAVWRLRMFVRATRLYWRQRLCMHLERGITLYGYVRCVKCQKRFDE